MKTKYWGKGCDRLSNYVAYHVHTELSLLDSATKFQDYIDRAVQLGQTAIAFTEHGNIYQWIAKKIACDKAGLKYLHGVECYLTEGLLVSDCTGKQSKIRDNYHTILIAKNFEGLLELNALVSLSSRDDHFYYKPRITFKEFLGISSNIIKISACLASPLNKMSTTHPIYEQLLRHYDYLEIQPHNFQDQIIYNRHLAQMSQKYGIPLIAGTDTHSLDQYKAECRSILMLAKHIEFANEDSFDLTYKSYDQIVDMFRLQDAIPEQMFLQAIENTNQMAESVESFELDTSFKYPKLYGARDREVFAKTIENGLQEKIREGAITPNQVVPFQEAIKEECRVFDKIDMSGFMLFMSELVTWCKSHGIPIGFNRGSCGGSRVAYVTNITDLNPETWHTVFSRFCNEDRKEIGDIDIDVSPSDRDKVYEYIINRFGQDKTAFILAIGTIKSKGCIDEICRSLGVRWEQEHLHNTSELKKRLTFLRENNTNGSELDRQAAIQSLSQRLAELKKENEKLAAKNPWTLELGSIIKKAFEEDEEKARKKYPDIFYYYDGLLDVAVSQSMHPAGIVASPVTLPDNYGTFYSDGKIILQIDMECVHEVSLVKYDILGLKNIEIIKDAYSLIGKPYPKSHEIDWDDEAVWADMLRSPVGIFQFEGDYAFQILCRYKPKSIFDMSLVTAALRPSGASYRDDLIRRKPHKNPSPLIDELLKENYGYLVYQEDVIKFLQEICGFTGSEADNLRRAIGRKQKDRLDAALPSILDGYCSKSPQPREVAEQEAKEFLQIIEDSSNYMFGMNHSIGYCMIGYLCAYLRYYYPYEFITSYLNNANNEDDIKNGSALAELYGIKIISPKFGVSKDRYVFQKDLGVIAKGIASVKYMSAQVANELYSIAKNSRPNTFMDLLLKIKSETSIDTRQREILIKIDYFSDYGNSKELLRIVDFFSFLKDGDAKKIPKNKINYEFERILKKHATDISKSGNVLKAYTITDMSGLLASCEQLVRSMAIEDFGLREKIQFQVDSLGYIDLTTYNPMDRRKLFINDVIPMKDKEKKVWGYVLLTRSIGTGKVSKLTVKRAIFQKNPIKKSDIVYAKFLEKSKSGYWYLVSYNIIP